VPRFKLAAFTIGTALAGLAGGLYAYMTQLIVPDAFGFIQSVTILAMVVIGGIGSTWGVVVGAILITLMPEMFRFINDYKLLVYGAPTVHGDAFLPGRSRGN
jgi:branched-chain amino acid transport system permease protein